MRYRAFGIRIETDVPLPGLVVDGRAVPADLRIWLGSVPTWVEDALTLPRVPCPKADFAGSRLVHALGDGGTEFFHVAYADGTEFVVSHAGDRVFGRWQPPLTLEDTLAYLVGPVLGITLRRQGRTCVHASAVAWNGRAVMFVGPAEAGKSTTAAAAVMRHGARILTDDIVALRRSGRKYFVEAGPAGLRLWNSSVRLLFGDESALPLLTPNWDKRYLDASPRFSVAAPLERICFLGGLSSPTSGARSLSPVSSRDALLLLAANTYGARFVDAAERRHEFSVLSELARTVPAVIVPDDYAARPIDAMLQAVRDSVGCTGSTRRNRTAERRTNWRHACTRLPITAQ
jgi:hypothetical protein